MKKEEIKEKAKSWKGKIEKGLKDSPSTSIEADRALLAIRIGLGIFFVYHGLGKFFGFAPDGGIEAFTGMLAGIGFPVAIFWAYLVAFVELFGGIALILGFFTRVSAVLLAVIALVAFVTVKNFTLGAQAGDLDLLSFAMALALVLAGPGKISLAERWYREDLQRAEDGQWENGVSETSSSAEPAQGNDRSEADKLAAIIAGEDEEADKKHEGTQKKDKKAENTEGAKTSKGETETQKKEKAGSTSAKA